MKISKHFEDQIFSEQDDSLSTLAIRSKLIR